MQSVEVLMEAAIVAVLHKELQVARQSLQEIDFAWLTAERARAIESVWGTSSTVIKPVRPPQKTSRVPVREPG